MGLQRHASLVLRVARVAVHYGRENRYFLAQVSRLCARTLVSAMKEAKRDTVRVTTIRFVWTATDKNVNLTPSLVRSNNGSFRYRAHHARVDKGKKRCSVHDGVA